MRSRLARWFVCTTAVLALTASGLLVFRTEQHIVAKSEALAAFDLDERDALRALGDLGAAQQAYVAPGQGVAFWMPKVESLTAAAEDHVNRLRETAASAEARQSLMEAAAAIADFRNIDKRARDYIRSSQSLMAADVIFTEGNETAANAGQLVERAGLAEHQAFDAFSVRQRQLGLYALAGAGGLAALALMLLTPLGRVREEDAAAGERPDAAVEPERLLVAAAGVNAGADEPRVAHGTLKAAAELCTELGRARDQAELTALLARAAAALEASGLIVWVGSSSGGDLRPALVHGYPPQTMARMPAIPRAADNAAAAAYRTGALQIVLARPGRSSGAVVAPLVGPDGCIGALTAEISGGAETSDTVHALAAIFAAQLTSAVANGATAEARPIAETRAANS